ncbi:MAG TPA: hypothetical protein VM536_14230, partial [Chloroflexia bacterium]|nr:hypothetical protein [Chloroflexia bacterium]
GIVVLLLLEMPLQNHPLRGLEIPASLQAVADAPEPGALLELPLTQHGGPDAARMLYQTAHGRPIAGGYLSRSVPNPYVEACSPFRVFLDPAAVAPRDIVSPSAASLLPELLAANGVGFLAVYNTRTGDPANNDPLPADQIAGLQAVAGRLATPLAADAAATTYRVRPGASALPRFVQLGGGWFGVEQRQSGVFRWVDGGAATACVFSPEAATGHLRLEAAAFGSSRRIAVRVGGQSVLDTEVPADGVLHTLHTARIAWPAGPQTMELVTFAPGTSPADLGQGRDARQLTVGVGSITWENGQP